MLEAVIHGKAKMGRLLEGRSNQPREDLVTSSIVGSIRFLSPASQARAFSILLGYEIDNLLEMHLWPRFRVEGRGWVEPDVVLKFNEANRPVYWIIEVKWGADFGLDQATREVESLKSAACIRGSVNPGPRRVRGYTLLGFEPRHNVAMDEFISNSCGLIHVKTREWSDITLGLRRMLREHGLGNDLIAWSNIVHDFLQLLPQGNVLADWPKLEFPRPVSFSFETLTGIENWNLINPVKVAAFEFGV